MDYFIGLFSVFEVSFNSYILPLTARGAGVAPRCVKPKEPENPVLVSLREAGSPASG